MRRLLPYLESNHSMTGRPLSTYFLDFLSMTEKNEEKVLTDGSGCGNITLALNSTAPTESDARVVELVDSLASGASARKGVRVRLPPRAPRRSKVRFAPAFLCPRQKRTPSVIFRDFVDFVKMGHPPLTFKGYVV